MTAVDYLNRKATISREDHNKWEKIPPPEADCKACPIGAVVPGTAIDIDMEQRADPICVYISAFLSKDKTDDELRAMLMTMPDLAKKRIIAHKGADGNFSAFELE